MAQFIQFFSVLAFIVTSVYLISVDLRTHRLPNLVVMPMIVALLASNAAIEMLDRDPAWLFTSIGIPLLVTAMFLVIHFVYPEGLGMGDIKVIFLIGLVLSKENPAWYFASVAVSFISGAIFALGLKARGRGDGEFAFGPFLLLPALVSALVGTFN